MRATVLDVVRDVVGQRAPDEMQLVEDLAGLDYGLVVRRMRQASSGGRADPLGFGLDDVTGMLTPLVLVVVDEACRAAVTDGTGRLMNRAATALGRLRPSARRTATPPEVPDLDREQLASVRRRVREEAIRRGLSDTDADALADSVVARLALAGTEDPQRAETGEPGESGETAEPGESGETAEPGESGESAEPGGSDDADESGGSGTAGGSGSSGEAGESGSSNEAGESGGSGESRASGEGGGGRREDGAVR